MKIVCKYSEICIDRIRRRLKNSRMANLTQVICHIKMKAWKTFVGIFGIYEFSGGYTKFRQGALWIIPHYSLMNDVWGISFFRNSILFFMSHKVLRLRE